MQVKLCITLINDKYQNPNDKKFGYFLFEFLIYFVICYLSFEFKSSLFALKDTNFYLIQFISSR